MEKVAGSRSYVAGDLWGLDCLKRDDTITILNRAQTILAHTLLEEEMALTTGLGRQDAHRRNTPYTERRVLELGNIPQLLHNCLLGVNRVGAETRSLAPISSTIVGGGENLASPNNNGHVQKGIMPSRVLAAVLGRVGVDGPLQESSRHIERVQLLR